jgi:tetratricopeptide (TPR) repeat protein
MRRLKVSFLVSFVMAAIIFTGCGELNKMVKMAPQVRFDVTPKVLEMHGDSVEATVKVTFPSKFFQKKALLEITPVLKYEGGEKAFTSLKLQGEDVQDNNKVVSFISGGSFPFTSKIAFEEGMRKSTLYAKVTAFVGEESVDMPEIKIADGTMSTALLFEKDAKPIAAADKFVRITNDKKQADILFVINRSDIRGKELRKEEIKALKEYVKAMNAEERTEIKNIEISAYASPDGEVDLNTKLSEKRMKNAERYFARELKRAKVEGLDKEGFLMSKFTPEDWDGFKKLMQASDIQDKELILRVLSMYSDPVVREKEIKNIAAAYEVIAEDILPQLRRSKLIVNVAKIGYSDDELKEIFVSNPDTLTIEELLYTATLHTDLNQKLAVYKKAAANYANDWRAHNNVAYILMKQGKYAEAKPSLEAAKSIESSNTTVMNNLGVVAYMTGDVVAAKEFYNAAAGAGNQVSYNQALLLAKVGEYDDALKLFSSAKISTFNWALVKLLNYYVTKNNDAFDASLGILKKVENQDAANVYYLKAILGAKKQDTDLLFNNLRTAIEKDPALGAYAKKDVEFAAYFEDGTFKSIVG